MSVATVTELWRTSATELAWAEAYPSRDAPVVERLKPAGVIPIGLTNSFEAGTDLDDGRVDAAAALEDRVGAITPIDPRWR